MLEGLYLFAFRDQYRTVPSDMKKKKFLLEFNVVTVNVWSGEKGDRGKPKYNTHCTNPVLVAVLPVWLLPPNDKFFETHTRKTRTPPSIAISRTFEAMKDRLSTFLTTYHRRGKSTGEED